MREATPPLTDDTVMPEVHITPTSPQFQARDGDYDAERAEVEAAADLMSRVHAAWTRRQRSLPPLPMEDLDITRTSLYYLAPITFAAPEGHPVDGYGAAVGWDSDGPTLTVFVGQGLILASPQARPWIDFYGAGELPGAEESPHGRGE